MTTILVTFRQWGCLIATFLLVESTISQTQNVQIDCGSNLGTFTNILGVNNGPNSGTNTAVSCYNTIGVSSIRTHDYSGPCDYQGYSSFYNPMTHQFNYSFNPNSVLSYNWASTNDQIQQIIDANAQPFFRLGISYPLDTSGGPATPMPKDADGINFKTFASICAYTVRHFNSGWNTGFNHGINYWEVWNEPNHIKFWTIDSVQAYYRMYHQVSDSLTNLNLGIRVGGPGAAKNAFYTSNSSTLVLDHNYINNFFSYCQNNNLALDFYSFHSYDRKNPYHIKQLADTLSCFLNQHNYSNTVLILSESNMDEMGQLGYQNSSKGCAYISSLLQSTIGTRISKVFWYKGVNFGPLCGFDDMNGANIKLNGYAYTFYNEMYQNTPRILQTTGSEVVTNNINSDLNLMTSSGASFSGDTIQVWISNLNSTYTSFSIDLQNTGWNNGNPYLLSNLNSEEVAFIQFIRNEITSIPEIGKHSNFAFYNSQTHEIVFDPSYNGSVQLIDMCGKNISTETISNTEHSLRLKNIEEGIYFIKGDHVIQKIYIY